MKQWLSRLWSRRSRTSDDPTPLAKIRERHADIRKELESIDRETDRLGPELDRLREDLLAARITARTPADVSRLEGQLKDLEPQAERLVERRSAVIEAMSELNDEVSVLRDQYKTANVESEKLLFEVYKLIATLATGTVVAVLAVTAALDSEPIRGWLLALAVSSLLLSILGSVMACLGTALRVGDRLAPEGHPRDGVITKAMFQASLWVSIGGLALGVMFSSMFLSANFERLPGIPDPPAVQPQGNEETTHYEETTH